MSNYVLLWGWMSIEPFCYVEVLKERPKQKGDSSLSGSFKWECDTKSQNKEVHLCGLSYGRSSRAIIDEPKTTIERQSYLTQIVEVMTSLYVY